MGDVIHVIIIHAIQSMKTVWPSRLSRRLIRYNYRGDFSYVAKEELCPLHGPTPPTLRNCEVITCN